MKRIAAITLLLVVGQAGAEEQLIDVQHDSLRSVTCWILNNTGISCLPGSSLLQVPTSTTTGEDQAARASMATSMCQSEQLPTTPRPKDQRLQL